MQYERSAALNLPYAEAVAKVRELLSEQGFGVLSEIDVRATLKQKRGVEIEDYVILGACNPDLAHRALDVDRSIGVLLPCNVVVSADGDRSKVQILDPQTMSGLTGLAELQPVADEAAERLQAVLDNLDSLS
ncbi:MAG: DUF302 domain-containing protein [Actinomycetes bacterium]